MRLIGQIEKIIYENEGFFIALLASGEKISGHYFDSSIASIENAAVTLEGEYVEHQKYGRTFRFHTLNVNQHELFFFLNRVVKGFPKKVTAELIETFGEGRFFRHQTEASGSDSGTLETVSLHAGTGKLPGPL